MPGGLARILIKQLRAWDRIREEEGTRPHICGWGGCTWMCRYSPHGRIVDMYNISSTDWLYVSASYDFPGTNNLAHIDQYARG